METLDYKENRIKGGVYAIRNKTNDKLYIGSTFYFGGRKSGHWGDLKRNKHKNNYLQKAWNKYGEDNFEFIILEIADESILFEREYHHILKHNVLEHSIGYNLEMDPRIKGNGRHSIETRTRISESRKGKLKGKIPDNLESLRLLQMRPVNEYKDNIFIRVHESNTAAGLFHNIDYKTINNNARGLTKRIISLPGITFKYKDGKPARTFKR